MPITINGTTGIAGVDGSASTPAVQGTDTNTGVFYPAADTVGVSTGGSERMRVDSSGNVGIGTSSPASRLHVSDAGAVADNCFNVSTPANDNVLLGANLVVDVAGTYTKPATSLSGAGILFEGINSLNGHGTISFLSAPDTNMGSATPLERMRIDSSGYLLINQTSNVTSSYLQIKGAQPAISCESTSTGSVSQVLFRNPNGQVGSIGTSGSSTSYNTSSDYRLKQDIVPMTGALATVAQLKPVTYKWKVDGSGGQGFIAHELQEVCPDAVTGSKDAVDENGKPEYQGIDTSFLVATLTAAIQEQQALIQQLQADVAALKGTS